MRALLIAGAAALLVGLAGCGQDTDAGGTVTDTSAVPPSTAAPSTVVPPVPPVSGVQDPPPPAATPSAPVSLSPTGPVVPPGVTQVPPARVDASAVPEYYQHRGEVWVYDGGRSLQLFAAASSGCGGVEARVVDQSSNAVRIFLRPLPEPQGGSPDSPACTAVITPRAVTVALDAPLGDRRVVIAEGR